MHQETSPFPILFLLLLLNQKINIVFFNSTTPPQEASRVIAATSIYFNCQGESSYHLKMLVPSVPAGAIIGKGGETIAEIQENKHKNMSLSLT